MIDELLQSYTFSCIISGLTSRIHSSLLLDWKRIVSKFFDTQLPPHLRFLVTPAVSALVAAAFEAAVVEFLSLQNRQNRELKRRWLPDSEHFMFHLACPPTHTLHYTLLGDSLSI